MSRKITISPAEVAERRMAALIEIAGNKLLEADWVSISFELKRLRRCEDLLEEALEAMLNLAPRIKNDRGGCFGNGGEDCTCTACKIRREIG